MASKTVLLPAPFGPERTLIPAGEGEFRVAVGLDVFEMYGKYLHGYDSRERRPSSSSPSTSPFIT